jgi:membrane-associated protease RseP (regulator of RpoE activity)
LDSAGFVTRKRLKRGAAGLALMLMALLAFMELRRSLETGQKSAARNVGSAAGAAHTNSAASPGAGKPQNSIEAAITNPVQFAKSHISGGIGAILTPDTATGSPRVAEVMAGSPSALAGLREGDIILKIDGVSTKGRALSANVESIRGFAWGSVTLAIQRGSTNLQCVLHRSSWDNMGLPDVVSPNPGVPKVMTTTNPGLPGAVSTNRHN